MYFGSLCQSALLPPLVRPSVTTLPHTLGVKQFLPLALDPTMAVNLVPGFSMDLVEIPMVEPEPHSSLSRQAVKQLHNQASAHYGGTKHAKKLKAMEAPKCKSRAKVTMSTASPRCHQSADKTGDGEQLGAIALSPQCKMESTLEEGREERCRSIPGREEETEEEKARRLLYCSLCKVAVNSLSQLEAHNCGTKHKTMLEARSGGGTIKSFPRPGVKGKVFPCAKTGTGLQNKVFHCETCDVLVNSETQLKQHISSRRHKDRAAGKPPKVKYSPYSKALKVPTAQPEKSGAKTELPQPLGACLLPANLAAVTPSAFPLQPGLFQPQPLPPVALLRPSPGPIRTPPSPVLFSPY